MLGISVSSPTYAFPPRHRLAAALIKVYRYHRMQRRPYLTLTSPYLDEYVLENPMAWQEVHARWDQRPLNALRFSQRYFWFYPRDEMFRQMRKYARFRFVWNF